MAVKYRDEARIEAPVTVVWRVLTDVERMPEWTESMREVTLRDATPLGLGSVVTIEQPRMKRATWVVDDWQPKQRFGWTSTSLGVRVHAGHILHPAGAQRTDATLTITFSGPAARVIAGLVGRRTETNIRMELAGLTTRSTSDYASGKDG